LIVAARAGPQEYYAHDVWQLLVCCVLMSRVSSWDTKHRVIAAFFEKCVALPAASHHIPAHAQGGRLPAKKNC
jgi:hypothetical protein